MKKGIRAALAVLLVFAIPSFAQQWQWQYAGDFLAKPGLLPHGVVVDPEGKIWVGCYGRTDTLLVGATSVPLSSVLVFNPDGTPASFSPIRFLTIGGVVDTMKLRCRGISLDHNGNILYVAFDTIYRINYRTGEGMNKVIPLAGKSLTEATADTNGFIYVGHVVPGGAPAYIYDRNFELYGFLADTTLHISRNYLASPDGKDVYSGTIYPGNGMVHYHSDLGPDGTYAIVDTIWSKTKVGRALWVQCMDWDQHGFLWAGTYWDVGATDYKGWYAFDPKQNWAMVDSVGANYGRAPTTGEVAAGTNQFFAPRGAAWSADGKTMYTADFDGNVIKKWTNPNPYTSVLLRNDQVARDFTLAQNYPNPFNPTTEIQFTLGRNGYTTLRVYDLLGREVATLVDRTLSAGTYKVIFRAIDLPSGTYVYQLKSADQTLTRKMMLVK